MKKDILVNKLVEYQVIENKDAEIYKFGIECLILKTITVVAFMSMSILMKEVSSFIIVLMTFTVVRRSAGGYHAVTKYGCLIFTCASMFIALALCRLSYTKLWIIFLILIIDVLLVSIAPIDNEKNKYCDYEIIYFKRKIKKILLAINFICILALVFNMLQMIIPIISGLFMSLFFVVIGGIQKMIIKKTG